MIDQEMLNASSRVALSALLHDLGKFAERARIDAAVEVLDANKQLYCPHRKQHTDDPGYFTHVHAAYTAIALDALERMFPELKGETMTPFASWKSVGADDSLINAAAKHHKPETFLQWVVATADRVASGFERSEFDRYNEAPEGTVTGKNHYTARQLTLFEQVRLQGEKASAKTDYKYRYRLGPLSPDNLFPVEAQGYETNDKQAAQAEYRKLWDGFIEALGLIPESHRGSLPLWLDHFETVWGVYTHAIPSATAFGARPDVSLYDHSRAVAALAVALWRYHADRDDEPDSAAADMRGRGEDWDTRKFLLIQGDFFGIQDFIFISGGETQKKAAKLMRGRSFYVSLLTECAALRVLEALDVPATSQVINAAGKFLIVAPNTEETAAKVRAVQAELDQWFLERTWGTSGIGLVSMPASCNDFRQGREGDAESPFRQLMKRLFDQLETVKLQRFSLCRDEAPAVFDDFLDSFDNEAGVCAVDGRSPAKRENDIGGGSYASDLAFDQIRTGECLTRYERVLITRESLGMDGSLRLPVFGYYINFTASEEIRGKFGREAATGNLRRAWDFALPDSAEGALWNGYARRHINACVPRWDDSADREAGLGKYEGIDESLSTGDAKTLNHIACEDRRYRENGGWKGIAALMALKGDVDNLGLVFQRGMGSPTFARMAGLSRQINAFFAIWLPWACRPEEAYANTYTVFAGGDDFFLIGPWHSQIRLARHMRQAFSRYVAANGELHFSAGLSITKPGMPVRQLAEMTEDALEDAKAHNPQGVVPAPKNSVACFGESMSFEEFQTLLSRAERLSEITGDFALSTGYVYGLLQLVDMAERVGENPENALWHSYFAYRTRRMLERRKGMNEEQRRRVQNELADEIAAKGIERHGGNYRVALFTHLYQQRT
ncbi:MAG: type III-A CRISPR-associated protein Cas10/Csm1 [Pseudomonadota bacterium]|nr:type III-A CRISPR-associated protein Cas10/Csm1 [Pseudomonadota bacterium]